jgi:nitronate monooxygenase
VVTRVFSGRPARGIANDSVRAWDGEEASILPYALQNAATRPLRNAAATRDDARFLSLWSGQAGRLARDLPAGELVEELVRHVAEVRAGLAPQWG